MNNDKPRTMAFLYIMLIIPLLASIAVACGTALTPSPAGEGETPSTATPTEPPAPTEPVQPASPTPTVGLSDTPQPASPTSTATPPPATDTPAPSPTVTAEDGAAMADVQHGEELFNSLGCTGCHGAQGGGGIGPTIAQTELSLARVIRQYRAPYQNMPRFGPDQVSETDIADIYAFLHTLPTPESPVPSVLAKVTPEAGLGTVRGTVRYRETAEPAADEQIYILPASQNPDGSLEFSYLPHLPADTTDGQGQFEITDVEAQLYAVFYTRQEAPVRDEAGNIVLVNVLPGEIAEVEGFIPLP